jgi:peptidoglycan/LPS O-acetylase OafA/YrhL
VITPFVGTHWRRVPILVAVLGLATTFLLAWFSFRFFETPFLNLKERYTRTSP